MKKLISLLLCVLTLVSLALPCYALTGKEIVQDVLDKSGKEPQQVENTVRDCYKDWQHYLGSDPEDISFELMFRVYYYDNGDIFSAYAKNTTFSDNISENYYWLVPNYGKGGAVEVVKNESSEYGWSVRKGTTIYKAIMANYPEVAFDPETVCNGILDVYPYAVAESIRFTYCDMLKCYLICFKNSDDTEYLVPYFSANDITWMENGQIYEATEFMITASEEYNKQLKAEGKKREGLDQIYTMYIVSGSVLVLVVAVIFILAFKKRHKLQNIEDENNKE